MTTRDRSAFGGLITSAPYTLIDSIPLYGITDGYLFGGQGVGAGALTDDLDTSSSQLSVSGASGDSYEIRTHEDFRYQAGKGTRCIMTAWASINCPAGQVRRWGLYDDNDGVFFEEREDGLYAVIRSSTSGSPVDTAQAIGTPVDTRYGNIYSISFQWLGVGRVDFLINQEPVASILHANTLAGPYMKTAFLPVSAEIVNTASSTAADLHIICSHVRSEGGQTPPLRTFGAFATTPTLVGGSATPLLSVRLASTINTVPNRSLVYPSTATATVTGGRAIVVPVVNATLTGASWASPVTGSGVETDVAATSATGGTPLIAKSSNTTSGQFEIDLRTAFGVGLRSLKRQAFTGTSDVLTLMGYSVSGAPDALAALQWGEEQ